VVGGGVQEIPAQITDPLTTNLKLADVLWRVDHPARPGFGKPLVSKASLQNDLAPDLRDRCH
jgi:hypothetical protein